LTKPLKLIFVQKNIATGPTQPILK